MSKYLFLPIYLGKFFISIKSLGEDVKTIIIKRNPIGTLRLVIDLSVSQVHLNFTVKRYILSIFVLFLVYFVLFYLV